MDENEIKAVSEAMNELRETGTLSAESLAKLSGSGDTAKKSLEKFSNQVLGVGQKMAGLTGQIAQGQGSFSSLGGTIEATTKVMGGLLSALPLVGGAAKALAEGVGQASKFVLDQLDTMAKNYQTLGDASAGAVDGVDGLMRQFNQLGNYSLPAFTKAVKNNALGLAAFQGTAAQGAEQLSKISGALTTGDAANRFLKLGMSLDSVGDATTEYLATSARYGLLQGNTTEELTKKTQNYIEEVDKIARLTGQTREAQAKEAQKSLVDARFRAKIADMEASGQAEQAQQLRQYVEGLGGAAGDAARALVTGIPLTKEAAAANLFANDAIRQNTLAIQDGKKATTAIVDTQQALADGTTRFGKQIMYAGDAFGGVAVQAYDYKAILAEQAKAENQGLTREQVIEKMQKKQMTASGKTTDQFVNAQLAVANTSKTLQQMGFDLAEFAIPAVNKFAEGLESVTDFMYDKFGGGSKKGAKSPEKSNKGFWKDVVGPMVGSLFGGGGEGASDKILETIKQRESGGNYQAQAKGSTASGAYQFIDSTWQSLTKKYGIGGEFKSAKMAPKEIQDAVAKKYVDEILKQSGGDVSKVPLTWYTGNPQGKMSQSALAANNGLTPEAYQSKWMADYNKVGAAGPTSGYKSANIVNPSSAGTETTAQSNRATEEQQANQSSDSLSKKLDEMIALQRQNNAISSKILQQAKA
jgi:Transglycosylase-like domain